jgi:putative alpha-1,2-mannosidase
MAGLALDFTLKPGEQLIVRIGSSYISTELAHRNLLADIPTENFDKAKAAARAVWNRELGKIAIDGGTESERAIFYTALYRSMGRPADITEEGDQYYGFDQKVHPARGPSLLCGQ